ncbi:TPA: zinc-ribbon domain-containing protein, partial [Escherichia coli]
MALIKCPECQKEVIDSVLSCPACGKQLKKL